MGDHSLLTMLTIVIPSYNRQRYLHRQIRFWKDSPVRLIIVDGSPGPLMLEAALPKNITYYHDPRTIEERFKFVASLVETEYCALLSDDEFFLKSALVSCIQFLEKNRDYGAAKGVPLGFKYMCGTLVGYESYADIRSSSSLDADLPEMRIRKHMSPYVMTTLWAVMRREVFLKTLFAMGADKSFKSAAVGEVQTSLLAAHLGKCKILDILGWLRSYENENIWWSFGGESFAEWYKNPENLCEVNRFISNMQAQLPDFQRDPFKDSILGALDEYVCDAERLKSSRFKSALFEFLPRLYKKLRQFAEIAIFYSLGCMKVKLNSSPINFSAKRLESAGVSIDWVELLEAQKIIYEFYFHRSVIK
jgi:glycosyltransferase domain-containing protein